MSNENPTGESTELQPSASSSSQSSLAWWRAPERLLAVAGAVVLRWFDKLGEEWTVLVLATALGAPATAALMRVLKRLKGNR